MSKLEIATSEVTVAAQFFENVSAPHLISLPPPFLTDPVGLAN